MSSTEEKNEKPSPQKLKEAREKGQVPKSQELAGFIFILLFFILFKIFSGVMLDGFLIEFKSFFYLSSYFEFNQYNLVNLFFDKTFKFIFIVFPVVFGVVVFAILANVLQFGFVFSLKSIGFDLSKINPVKGLKKIFSKKTVFEIFKGVLKLSIIFFVIYVFGDYVDAALQLEPTLDSGKVKLIWVDSLSQVLLGFIFVSILWVLLDFIFSRWEFTNNMKMSKKEVKDEHKKREGDPEIKSKIKKLQRELLDKSASLSSVKNADLIIVNPTHVAVALKYDKLNMIAPEVLCMGKGNFANKIRERGRLFSVPVYQDVALARKIFKKCKSKKVVPVELYPDLAPAFKWLYSNKQ